MSITALLLLSPWEPPRAYHLHHWIIWIFPFGVHARTNGRAYAISRRSLRGRHGHRSMSGCMGGWRLLAIAFLCFWEIDLQLRRWISNPRRALNAASNRMCDLFIDNGRVRTVIWIPTGADMTGGKVTRKEKNKGETEGTKLKLPLWDWTPLL